MFDFVPLALYSDVYYYVLLFITIISVVYLIKYKLTDRSNIITIQLLTFFLIVLAVFYMGTREISGAYFIDMGTYNITYLEIQQEGFIAIPDRDYLFYYFMYLCTLVMSNKFYFLTMNILYFIPIYFVSKTNFKNLSYYLILMSISSFSFWAYGTNGIRNGLATSCFLLVFATNKKWLQIVIMIIAYNLHSSMLIPSLAYAVAYFYKNPKHILYGWLACIPISLVAGGPIQGLFAGLMEDDRTAYLTDGNINNDNFSSTGFRWDFVLYSASAVFFGWYYIFKKEYDDNRYRLIYSTYLVANAFWILVIKANFSNRFAY